MGRAVAGVGRRAFALIKEATGEILILLLELVSHLAPVGIAASRFISRALRSAAYNVQTRLEQLGPLILSSALSLLQSLVRSAARLAERGGTGWLGGTRWASAAFSSLVLYAGYWFLILASYVLPALKDLANASRRTFTAGQRRARTEAARAAVAISFGSAWLRRRGVPLTKLALSRTIHELRSGLSRASAATKTAVAQVRAGSASMARRFELDRRVAALLSASLAARNRALPRSGTQSNTCCAQRRSLRPTLASIRFAGRAT